MQYIEIKLVTLKGILTKFYLKLIILFNVTHNLF
jgi:hypothetical protein